MLHLSSEGANILVFYMPLGNHNPVVDAVSLLSFAV